MKKSVLLSLALTCITIATSPAWSQIYRTTDADGNVIFTDTPPPGGSAEQVNLQRTNTAEPPAVPTSTEPKAEEVVEEKMDTAAQTVVITSPSNDETIPTGAGGNFSVVAKVEPPLTKGQSLRLSLDGNPVGKLMQSGFWDLESVERGTHNLVVAVVNSNGQVIGGSKPVQIHVMRTTINRPAAR